MKTSMLRLFFFSRNFGNLVAISAGIEESSGDAIIVMDSDMQGPPEVISQMLVKWEDGYEVVDAKRIKRYGESFIKKYTAALFYRFINGLSDVQIPLDTGDFRLTDRKIKIQLSKFREKSRFIRGIISWIGYRQTSVEFDRQERLTGETKYPLWKMIKFALDGITSFSITPLKIALGIGLFSMITAFLSVVMFFIDTRFFVK